MRAWRSDLEEDDVSVDLKMLRDSQRYCVQAMAVTSIQIAIWSPKIGEGSDWALWITLLFFGGIAFAYWKWWRLERCRAEIEDLLAERDVGFDVGFRPPVV